MKQDIAWFESNNQLEITAKFNKELLGFQEAVNDKISVLISSVSMLLTSFVIAFIFGWLMTLVVLTALILIFVGAFIYGIGYMRYNIFKGEVMGKAGALVEQSVRSIKTIKLLNGEGFESNKYSPTRLFHRETETKS